jgi:hypothetical protein
VADTDRGLNGKTKKSSPNLNKISGQGTMSVSSIEKNLNFTMKKKGSTKDKNNLVASTNGHNKMAHTGKD